MNRTKLQPIILLPVAATLTLLMPACVVTTDRPANVEHDARSIDLKGAKSAHVEIEIGAGELVMRGGAAPLMDADFRYRGDAKPEVHYDVTGTRGSLTVRQPEHHSIGNNGENKWDLQLNEDVPLDINVKMGAGTGRLELGNTALHSLKVEIGAGEMKLDLTGHPHGDIDVEIHGGVGEATVRLPRSARVDIEAHGGIGGISAHGLDKRDDRWVNEPSGKVDATIHAHVTGGIGNINLICE